MLFYSIINCAVCSWAYIIADEKINSNVALYWIVLLLITLIGSIIIALIIGIIKQKKLVEYIFEKSKLKKINPIPTAWDYIFSRQEPSWLIVTLKSGRIVYGYFSTESFASSDLSERDLYIEEIYSVDINNKWKHNARSRGVLISKDEIKTIEFLA